MRMMDPFRLPDFVLLLFILLVHAMPCGADSVVVQGPTVCQDASVYSAPEARDRSFDGLNVSRANVSYEGLIRFDLGGVPADRPVKDAVVMLFMSAQFHNSPLRLVARPINAAWNESEVTYDRRTKDHLWEGGDRDGKEITSFDISGSYGKGWIVLRGPELTRLVDQWVRSKRENHGLLLAADHKSSTGPSMKFFDSSETDRGDRHPKLVIDFDESIDPQEHGFVSESDLLRIPLYEQVDELAAGAASLGVDMAGQLANMQNDLASVNTLNPADVTQIETRIGNLRTEMLSAIWPGQQVVAWKISPWQDLSPTQLPGGKSVDLQRRMLRGEYQEISLALANLTDQPQAVRIRLDLPEGMPSQSVQVRASYWLKLRLQNVLRGEKSWMYLDDPLPRVPHDGMLRLAASQTRRLWLTVDSSHLKAGRYTIGIILSTGTAQNIEVPLDLEVLPIELETDPDLHVFSYAYLTRRSTLNHEAFAVKDLKSHYENTFVVDAFVMPEVSENGAVLKAADFSRQERYFLQFIPDAKKVLFWWCGDCGSPGNVTFGQKLPWLSEPWRKAMKTWITNWYAYLQSQGFDHDRVLMYPFDETYDNGILGRTEYQALGEIAGELHKIDPRIKVFANPVAFGPEDFEAQRQLADDIDVWSVWSSLLQPGDHRGWPRAYNEAGKRQMREFFQQQQARGKEVWSYLICSQETPVTVYRQHAWQAWSAGITGLGLWSYNDIRGGTSWDETADDFTMIYELNDAPQDIPRDPYEPFMPSRRWQARRAGIQDYLLLRQVRRNHPELSDRLVEIESGVFSAPTDWKIHEKARHALLDILVE